VDVDRLVVFEQRRADDPAPVQRQQLRLAPVDPARDRLAVRLPPLDRQEGRLELVPTRCAPEVTLFGGSAARGVSGQAVTPFVLSFLHERSGGRTLAAPQARLMSLVSSGILNQKLPWTLVLLGIFMVTAPIIQQGVAINLPKVKAEALPDLRPAQWSKLIFNATVNAVAALTGLPHDFHFAEGLLGDLVHGLVDEGKAAAHAAGVELGEDPWEMNVLATKRGHAHRPSMLEDVEAHRRTEIESITGALVREANRVGVEVPLHTALYRLVRAKEASYSG